MIALNFLGRPHFLLLHGSGQLLPVLLCSYISGVAAAKAEAFAPHYDGVFVRSPDEKSVYTVLAYLSDEFSGGQTRFYHPRCTI